MEGGRERGFVLHIGTILATLQAPTSFWPYAHSRHLGFIEEGERFFKCFFNRVLLSVVVRQNLINFVSCVCEGCEAFAAFATLARISKKSVSQCCHCLLLPGTSTMSFMAEAGG